MEKIPLSEAEIQELVRKAQGGDDDAFSRLYEHFFDPVYRYAAFRLPVEMAEDVASDVFIRAWEKLHTYHLHRSVPFGAWLFRIARHRVIDIYRTRHQSEELLDVFEDPDILNRADERTHQADRLRLVRTALDRLPRRYREVLVLMYISGLSTAEVAQTLHMTEGGVRILKLRAMRKLESFLPPDTEISA